MLVIFDLDGTLVEDHLIDVECEACDGEGVSEPGAGMSDPCPVCKGRRTRLVPRTDIAYTDPRPIDGVPELLKDLRERYGPEFAIATNQGGVALGFQQVEEVKVRIAVALERLEFFAGAPFSVHYCLDHPDGKGEYADPGEGRLWRRKPEPGMLFEACREHGDLSAVYLGDRESDHQAAIRAGLPFVFAQHWHRDGNGLLPVGAVR